MHLSGKTPIGTRNTTFNLNGEAFKVLQDGEFDLFLGKPVGFHTVSSQKELARLMGIADRILEAKLAPWQRLDAMKTFFYPSLGFQMRTAQFKKSDWTKLDNYIRAKLKKTLNVSQEASNDYIYGPTKKGCIGIPVAADDSDYYQIDNAFKLLTSADSRTSELAVGELQTTVQKRLKRNVDHQDCALFLTGENEGEFRNNTNALSNAWTVARKASSRNNVGWTFDNFKPALKIEETTLHASQRHQVMKTLRNKKREAYHERLCELPSQGKVMECVAVDKASSHFLRSGQYTRFADWRFINKARLNLLPINANRHDPGNKACRRCGYEKETLPHVINHCMRYSQLYTRRHNAVVNRVKKAAQSKYTVLAENEAVVGTLRPDLVIVRNGSATVIDVTIPFENRLEALAEARRVKCEKYQPLAEALSTRSTNVSVEAFVVGSLGSWDKGNDTLMKMLCSRRYLSIFNKLCVSDVIRYSRDIYVEHITRMRQ